jgi:flagellar hook-basal body complex protein FliE
VVAQLDGTAKEAPEAYEMAEVKLPKMDLGGDPDLDDVHIAVSATDGAMDLCTSVD